MRGITVEPRQPLSSVSQQMNRQSANPEASARFEVRRKEVGDLLVARGRTNGLPSLPRKHFESLLSQLKGVSEGPVLCLYSDGEPGKGLIVEWCVPVGRPVDSKQFETKILRGCTVLSYLHTGSKKALGQAWELMFDYIEGNNIQVSGPRREIYHHSTTPDNTMGPIELQVPLASAP